ncbi:cyclin-like protein [Phyllosticta citribraziliensis]|uniref:RNA polymerase II holoenzyme cyclin-like subunit n=1 Tax=Phyllosticta citribraziliensis TaxID=989973 RepID=A0ABR1L7V4_9PEZI
MHLSEDEIYRSSTQYRLWSFTPDKLRSLRQSTNAAAAERVKANINRFRNTKPDGNGADGADHLDPLTPEEELKLVVMYCKKCIELGNFLKFPSRVIAAAIQYVKRFYLFNSAMVYDPKKIMPSCLFLATKTEVNFISSATFASKLPNKTAEDILAPEYLIIQALRFTLEVRHPHRGLDGANLELMDMAKGQAALLPGSSTSAQEIQADMMRLPSEPNGVPTHGDEASLLSRVKAAWGTARETLKTVATFTDVYFFYTPSQIWLAALFLADEPLSLFYIDTKFPLANGAANPAILDLKHKVVATVRACAEMLQAGHVEEPREEIGRIARKRDACSDPEKADLIGLHAAQKRGGALEGQVDENAAKRRKLEREQSQQQAEEFWGPELKKE